MEIRNCTDCGPRPREDFGWKNKHIGRINSRCRACQRRFSREWYKNNKDKHLLNVKRRRDEVVQNNQKIVFKFLSTHPCVDCFESDIVVLDFDHVSGRKEACIGQLWTYSTERLLREIEKCIVRCANCHRRKTAKQFRWARLEVEPQAGFEPASSFTVTCLGNRTDTGA